MDCVIDKTNHSVWAVRLCLLVNVIYLCLSCITLVLSSCLELVRDRGAWFTELSRIHLNSVCLFRAAWFSDVSLIAGR